MVRMWKLSPWKVIIAGRRAISSQGMITTRTRDHGFDEYMESCKKIRKAEKLRKILANQPNQAICIARLDTLARRHGMKQHEAGEFVIKHSHVFEVFEHPVDRMLWCRLTRAALSQMREEAKALAAQQDEAVVRLQKLLMLAQGCRLGLHHVLLSREEFALPEDLETWVTSRYPHLFRISGADAPSAEMKYIEIVKRDPKWAVCAIEDSRIRAYRQQGKSEDSIRFSFPMNFPAGFKAPMPYKIALNKWQKLPYWSPYEDTSQHDLHSRETQKALEKRVVATVHELLSITVEKKITLEKIAHFSHSFNLPNKLKNFLLQYQGIFYFSTRDNQTKLHTIFLREAYRKGELVDPNPLYLARRKLMRLILQKPRKASLDERLADSCKAYSDDERKK